MCRSPPPSSPSSSAPVRRCLRVARFKVIRQTRMYFLLSAKQKDQRFLEVIMNVFCFLKTFNVTLNLFLVVFQVLFNGCPIKRDGANSTSHSLHA